MSDYKSLEKDVKFKRAYLNKIPWWKSALLISPSLLLFVGVVGIIHFSRIELLYSWRSVPYIAIFLLGALWLRYIKSHLQKKILNKGKSFLCCMGSVIGEKNGYYYFLFTKDDKRHHSHWIQKIASSIDFSQISEELLLKAEKEVVSLPLSNDNDESKLYLRAIAKNVVTKEYKTIDNKTIVPLVYISDKYVFPGKQKFTK